MRILPEGMRDLPERAATTLATAWRVVRLDGRTFGFTDHDEDLRFADTLFRARTGWTAGEAEAELGLSPGSATVEGALADDAIGEADLAAGLFDGARIEIFRVDWDAPATDHVLMDAAELGEVTRGAGGFRAELRGLASRLDRTRGRRYRRRCDATLGDARCGVDLGADGRWRTGQLRRPEPGTLVVEGLGNIDPSAFAHGRAMLPDGRSVSVLSLAPGRRAGEWRIDLGDVWPGDVGDGAEVRLAVGCDRSFPTCRDRFRNAANFRGFPHIPGTDNALAVAKSDMPHDGAPWVP